MLSVHGQQFYLICLRRLHRFSINNVNNANTTVQRKDTISE